MAHKTWKRTLVMILVLGAFVSNAHAERWIDVESLDLSENYPLSKLGITPIDSRHSASFFQLELNQPIEFPAGARQLRIAGGKYLSEDDPTQTRCWTENGPRAEVVQNDLALTDSDLLKKVLSTPQKEFQMPAAGQPIEYKFALGQCEGHFYGVSGDSPGAYLMLSFSARAGSSCSGGECSGGLWSWQTPISKEGLLTGIRAMLDSNSCFPEARVDFFRSSEKVTLPAGKYSVQILSGWKVGSGSEQVAPMHIEFREQGKLIRRLTCQREKLKGLDELLWQVTHSNDDHSLWSIEQVREIFGKKTKLYVDENSDILSLLQPVRGPVSRPEERSIAQGQSKSLPASHSRMGLPSTRFGSELQ